MRNMIIGSASYLSLALFRVGHSAIAVINVWSSLLPLPSVSNALCPMAAQCPHALCDTQFELRPLECPSSYSTTVSLRILVCIKIPSFNERCNDSYCKWWHLVHQGETIVGSKCLEIHSPSVRSQWMCMSLSIRSNTCIEIERTLLPAVVWLNSLCDRVRTADALKR